MLRLSIILMLSDNASKVCIVLLALDNQVYMKEVTAMKHSRGFETWKMIRQQTLLTFN